ncbi:MAG: hypothetical protein ACKO58_01670 [Cyanobium sp.]
MACSALSPFCRIAPEGGFCKLEEDPFLLLESSLRRIERILLRRTWNEHPHGGEEIVQCCADVVQAVHRRPQGPTRISQPESTVGRSPGPRVIV